MTGTLAELAHSRADLALIALPPAGALAALEIAGRIRCRGALVLSAGMPAAQCAEMHQIARRYGVQLLGPNGLGFQRARCSSSTPAPRWGPLAAPDRWAWSRNRAR